MLSFKQFIIEEERDRYGRRVEPLDAIHADLDHHIANGEIVKPEFNRIKERVNMRVGEHDGDKLRDVHLAGLRDPVSTDIYYNVPYGAHQLKSFEKKIKKMDQTHPMVQAANQYVEQLKPMCDKLEQLKGMVVTTAKKREEKKRAEVQQMQKRFSDSSSLISVLTQHKDAFVENAKKQAGEMHDEKRQEIERAGGLDNIAPRPDYKRMGHIGYKQARAKRARYEYFDRTPRENHVESEGKAADASYMAWVDKMTQKIGKPVEHAEMQGSPWNSHITIRAKDGEEQRWNTQMIINRSKYNNLFHQFPSRRLDRPDSL
jgi:hypothetical protein